MQGKKGRFFASISIGYYTQVAHAAAAEGDARRARSVRKLGVQFGQIHDLDQPISLREDPRFFMAVIFLVCLMHLARVSGC